MRFRKSNILKVFVGDKSQKKDVKAIPTQLINKIKAFEVA